LTRLYRILRRPYAKTPLDGEGAYHFGGRWSSPGTRVVYTAEHLSLAMIEYFVHIDRDDPPKDLVVVTAEVPDGVSRTSIAPRQLPPTWRHNPPPAELTRIGDRFIREHRSAILIVPSAIAPAESNWLINPLHAEFSKIRVHSIDPFAYDARFFGQ
jgi:RES domain-containing protein